MSQFEHLSALAPKGQAEFVMYQIAGEPSIMVEQAGESNRGYYTALIRRNARNARKISAGKIDAAMLAQSRDEDRELYSRHVIKSWEGILDKDGAEVDFSPENCYDFLKALPNWLFDELRVFAGEPANFIEDEDPAPLPEEVAELGES